MPKEDYDGLNWADGYRMPRPMPVQNTQPGEVITLASVNGKGTVDARSNNWWEWVVLMLPLETVKIALAQGDTWGVTYDLQWKHSSADFHMRQTPVFPLPTNFALATNPILPIFGRALGVHGGNVRLGLERAGVAGEDAAGISVAIVPGRLTESRQVVVGTASSGAPMTAVIPPFTREVRICPANFNAAQNNVRYFASDLLTILQIIDDPTVDDWFCIPPEAAFVQWTSAIAGIRDITMEFRIYS